ncbi:cytochrome P450 [Nostoc sp. CHAB 5784]|uniref:cytochrome P450 n=1 Tax=Nostoc mirabile TaxID=2907820 RepID=UPI001E57DB33|nr:cytochrome P450 [Nostoc mirabile]MCC5669556.1 cytochrome P450 [Nostoc mirabile CHAB5784]MEA5506765.1 cytochrome P450 [Halotia wernerae UHCC 0503]
MNKNTINTENTQKLRSVKAFKFNPLDKKFHANPYPTYHRLRSEDPVHRNFAGEWMLTRYADVKFVLKDSRFATDRTPERIQEKNIYVQHKGKDFNILTQTVRKWLLFVNPPDHTRLRGMVNKAFFLKTIERMRPQIQQVVEELIGKVQNTGKMDIISDFASPLPVIVMSKILGLHTQRHKQLKYWADQLFLVFEPLMSLEDYERLNQAALEFTEYLREVIIERLKQPQEDLLSTLILARTEQGQLTKQAEDEILSFCTALFSAGEETTVNLIGNGMLALLHHPNQMEKLKHNPGIIQSAIEELLRFDSPVQLIARIATEDVLIGNKMIRAGERIVVSLGAVNRDPSQFPDPDLLELTRSDNNHLAFGDSIHACLGSALARAQGQIAIGTLVQQLSDLKLNTDKLEWQKNVTVRGLKALPVSFKH